MKTASWFTELDNNQVKIGISRGVPRGIPAGYRMFRALNPGLWFDSVGYEEYLIRYMRDVLGPLNAASIAARIKRLAGEREPVLVCYEKPGGPEWCHRAFISLWFADKLGLQVPEVGFQPKAFGWSHPLLPPVMRNNAAQLIEKPSVMCFSPPL